jgi:hypothetical protein
MQDPTPEQQKYIRSLIARTPSSPSVVPPGGTSTSNPSIRFSWKKGAVEISGAEQSNLNAISQQMGWPVIDWINQNC